MWLHHGEMNNKNNLNLIIKKIPSMKKIKKNSLIILAPKHTKSASNRDSISICKKIHHRSVESKPRRLNQLGLEFRKICLSFVESQPLVISNMKIYERFIRLF